MEIDTSVLDRFSRALREHADEFAVRLGEDDIVRLGNYYSLLLKWNSRLHLVAPCSPEQFATRHVLESLLLLRHLPSSARVADVGSGAGLPIIPCLILREDLSAVLIESSQKKGVFLREALRGMENSESPRLIVGRFEETPAPEVDLVSCRAIERFERIAPTLIEWAPSPCTLLLFAGKTLKKQLVNLLPSVEAELIPGSEQRFLVVARV